MADFRKIIDKQSNNPTADILMQAAANDWDRVAATLPPPGPQQHRGTQPQSAAQRANSEPCTDCAQASQVQVVIAMAAGVALGVGVFWIVARRG